LQGACRSQPFYGHFAKSLENGLSEQYAPQKDAFFIKYNIFPYNSPVDLKK